jgi:hypothetical protein
MIRSRILLTAFFLCAIAGCTDSVDSVMREYRATTNESVDALMMINTEAQAERMTKRIFAELSDRYGKIDKKLELVKNNRDKIDFIREVFESDGLQLYITDMKVNKTRVELELARLRNLRDQYLARERELLGEPDKVLDPYEICPYIEDLVYVNVGMGGGKDVLKPLRNHFEKPAIGMLMSQFPSWKVQGYTELHAKFMERRPIFEPKNEIRLIW